MKLVHIPKTGGCSIRDTYPFLQVNPKAGRPHDPQLIFNELQGEEAFCVIRDPIDRLLSTWRFLQKPDDAHVFNETLEEFITGKEFPFMTQPQSRYIHMCDHLLLFDKLETEVNSLLASKGIEVVELQHKNQSKPYNHVSRHDITEENMEKIKLFYKEDFELYEKLKSV